jgi:hypothetical protein
MSHAQELAQYIRGIAQLTLRINTNNHRVGEGALQVTVKVWRREQG